MMIQHPLFDEAIVRDVILADLVTCLCGKNPTDPRDAT